jgi:hypothetical protein
METPIQMSKTYNFRLKMEMCKWSITAYLSTFTDISNTVIPLLYGHSHQRSPLL